MRIPTSAGLVTIEAGPATSFDTNAAPRPRTAPTKYDLRAPRATQFGDAHIPWNLHPGLHAPLLPDAADQPEAADIHIHMPVSKFFHRASAGPAGLDSDITLCTQLDTLGLPYLARLAEQWGGPLSVVLCVYTTVVLVPAPLQPLRLCAPPFHRDCAGIGILQQQR